MTARPADVVVVGAGPAGAACALLLARAGCAVVLADKAHFPRPKPCGEYTSPAVAPLLDRLGLRAAVDAVGARWLDGMRLSAPDGSAWLVDYAAHGQRALAISRAALDHVLVAAAARAGARVVEGFRVEGLLTEGAAVVGVRGRIGSRPTTLAARLVVGADGLHSAVARALGASEALPWPRRLGLVAHYEGLRLDGQGEMYVGPRGYCGLAPSGNARVNVGIVVDMPRPGAQLPAAARFERALVSIPAAAGRLAGARRVSAVRGVGPLGRRARRVCGPGWLLVGDAAGFLDPFTGDGVYEALRGGELAAAVAVRALAAADLSARALAPYARRRRQTFGAKRRLGWLLQVFVHQPALLAYALRRLNARPALGRPLSAALGDFGDAAAALHPAYLCRVLRP
ncbi:MAG TPA: geranylgeranyl reductase family protein [Chloroflexota bacterium]|nr:geranylgeranyl reductase family protein [Chloroflexota bacterium]